MAGLSQRVPWQARIAAKIILARLPLSSALWRRLSLFKHGRMHEGSYAHEVFTRHLADYMTPGVLRGKTLLELGPGDGIATGLLASSFGADRTILVDAGDFASREPDTYRPMIEAWERRGIDMSHLAGWETFEDLLDMARTVYLTGGLAALTSLAPQSVDIQFSNAVLEHVRRGEFTDTITQLRRILKTGGHASHQVDLRDHLGGALNNLRFSDRVWESSLFSESGFYTNRIRYGEMLDMFRAAGFEVEVTKEMTWPSLPTPRRRLHHRFREIEENDLCVFAFDLILR